MMGAVKRTYWSPLRQEAARNTRARIRDAAAELFVTRGYTATTMRQIAQAAGVAERTVYAAFASKAELFSEVVSVTLTGDEQPVPVADRPEFRQALSEQDPRRALELLVDYGAEMLERAGPLIMAGVHSSGADEDMRRFDEQGAQATRTNYTAMAQALASQHALRPSLGEGQGADVLFVLGSPHVHHLLRQVCGWSAQEYRDWLLDALTRILLAN
jgi:AcrR family transcriptional regulator